MIKDVLIAAAVLLIAYIAIQTLRLDLWTILIVVFFLGVAGVFRRHHRS